MLAETNTGSHITISWSTRPDGPYTKLFTYDQSGRIGRHQSIQSAATTVYLKVENTTADPKHRAAFAIDDLWVLSTGDKSPYATGDAKDNGWAETNFGLYASVFVGLLGGIVETTDVEKILRLDCLASDYFHAPAYPSYLYYNPYPDSKRVTIEVGHKLTDLYDTTTQSYLQRRVRGRRQIELPADSARVLVLVPSGGKASTNDRGNTSSTESWSTTTQTTAEPTTTHCTHARDHLVRGACRRRGASGSSRSQYRRGR